MSETNIELLPMAYIKAIVLQMFFRSRRSLKFRTFHTQTPVLSLFLANFLQTLLKKHSNTGAFL